MGEERGSEGGMGDERETQQKRELPAKGRKVYADRNSQQSYDFGLIQNFDEGQNLK